jgi:protein SCO1/2
VTLANGTLSVPKLEAKARAAGLLGDHQRVTHAKLFERAKKSLGIGFTRAGFGTGGEWRGALPEKTLIIAIVLLLGAIMAVTAWDADPDEAWPNEVHFPTACSDRSQRQFDHATSLLHSRWYAHSERTYAAIIVHEPDCAIAYWGVAMSRLKRPVAGPPSAEDARAAMEAMRAATGARNASARERAYIDALAGLVADGALTAWPERTLAYEKAMETVARAYPEDREATIFYALALNMARIPSDFVKQTKATELLLVALSEDPNHPGIAHYLTYCLNNAPSADREPPLSQGAGMKAQTRIVLLGSLGALLAFAVCSLAFLAPGWTESARQSIGGSFTLTTGKGRTVSDRDFLGKWLLVYFGYTHCPDACPTTLLEIEQTLQQLGPLAGDVQPIFITIDPERDTPDAVGAYVEAFDSRIIGLSGTSAEIANVAKAYRVYYKKDERSREGSDYLMEHSAFVYDMGPTGAYVTLFSPQQGQGSEHMALRLRVLMTQKSQ